MFDWRELKKYDAHVHLLPPHTLGVFKEEDPACWDMPTQRSTGR